jgi:hypothetical protein
LTNRDYIAPTYPTPFIVVYIHDTYMICTHANIEILKSNSEQVPYEITNKQIPRIISDVYSKYASLSRFQIDVRRINSHMYSMFDLKKNF